MGGSEFFLLDGVTYNGALGRELHVIRYTLTHMEDDCSGLSSFSNYSFDSSPSAYLSWRSSSRSVGRLFSKMNGANIASTSYTTSVTSAPL